MERERTGRGLTLNLTSFIDMMFILVVFFLATSRFQEAERDEKIRLARSSSKLPISTLTDTLVINIDKDGQRIVDGKTRTLEELEEIVRRRREEGADSEVVVRADVRARVGPLAEALEICHRLGFKTPNVTYEDAGGSSER
jgi:biopolymer transport protein ExbD